MTQILEIFYKKRFLSANGLIKRKSAFKAYLLYAYYANTNHIVASINIMLTDEQIIKFQELWKQRFKEELSREQALAYGMNLIRLLQIVYKEK